MFYNNEFIDVISEVNDVAKSKGFINGKDWANQAFERGLISFSTKAAFINLCGLRINQAHGYARDIRISLETYETACYILKCIKSSNFSSQRNRQFEKKHSENRSVSQEEDQKFYSAYPVPRNTSLKNVMFKKYIDGPKPKYITMEQIEGICAVFRFIFVNIHHINDEKVVFDSLSSNKHWRFVIGKKLAEQEFREVEYATRGNMPMLPHDTDCFTCFYVEPDNYDEDGYFLKFNNYDIVNEDYCGSVIFGTYSIAYAKSKLIFCPYGLYYIEHGSITKVLDGNDVVLPCKYE